MGNIEGDVEEHQLLIQAFYLTSVNEDKKNVFHHVCKMG